MLFPEARFPGSAAAPEPAEHSVREGGLRRGPREMLGLSAHVRLSSAELARDVLDKEIHSANPVSGD